MFIAESTITATVVPGNTSAGPAETGYNGGRPAGKAQMSDLAWVIGLILLVILALIVAGWSIMRLSKWRKGLGNVTSDKHSSFSLTELQDMQKKGLITQQEYQQLRQAYVGQNGK